MKSTRRDALKALGITVAVATFGSLEAWIRNALAENAAPGNANREPQRGSAPADQGYFADLEGRPFATCTLKVVGDVEHGTVPVQFVDGQGQSFTVDVLRHDPSSPGVARAGSLGVYMKVGRGQRATREDHGLAAMALAAELARRELEGRRVPTLLTLSERAAVRTHWNLRDAPARTS
jgi:hypothetical protein